MPIKNAKYLTETDVLSRLVNYLKGLCLHESGGIFCGYFRALF
jgi:hypothetical protein